MTATIQALIAREATGHRYLVDVSESEPLASFQFVNVGGWTYMVKPEHRGFSGKVVDVSGAGTSEIQRTIIATRGLDLPRD